MSTRSIIIRKNENNQYEGIYCHNDGYTSHNGRILLDHYADPEKVKSLIQLGDLSQLAPNISPTGPHSFNRPESGVVVAYGRDRGETGTEAMVCSSIKAITGRIDHNGYVYVFEDGSWTCNGIPLAIAIEAEANGKDIKLDY